MVQSEGPYCLRSGGSSSSVSSPGQEIVLCSWARPSTLALPLSTQVYKWVPANLMLGFLRWTSIPLQQSLLFNSGLKRANQELRNKFLRWPLDDNGVNFYNKACHSIKPWTFSERLAMWLCHINLEYEKRSRWLFLCILTAHAKAITHHVMYRARAKKKNEQR